jgi:putative ABC transport system substrate-binding protein
MRRREFIVFAGAIAVCPRVVVARGTSKHLGVLMGYREDDEAARARVDAFFQTLEQSGWRQGQNLEVEYYWAAGKPEQIKSAAVELVRRNPDAVLAATTAVVRALLQETRTTPIVFLSVSDPVSDGFVQSLPRPGGNATGFTNLERSLSGKWAELVMKVAPGLRRLGALFNPTMAANQGMYYWPPFEAAAIRSGVQAVQAPVLSENDIQARIAELADTRDTGLVVMPDVFTVVHRSQIISLAAVHRLVALYPYRYFAENGGVMSYGVELVDQYRRAAHYVDQVLRGKNPADLPVQAPAKFELIINQKTAKGLDLEIPSSLLAQADEVIE